MSIKLIKIALAAGFALAITLTFSCSGGDDGGGNGNGGGNAAGGSGGSCNIGDYRTVQIGTQLWMAENWNCNIDGSACYDNKPANCAKYGRLYNWATAMALPDCGSGTSCSPQIDTNHRGICPSGWHIPSDDEWKVLKTAVDGSSASPTAGTKLKARSGWNEGGNGTDEFGFSALPGGYTHSSGNFYEVGNIGFWWSASENGTGSGTPFYYVMVYDRENASHYTDNSKRESMSVRCVKD